jgi:hypothetical protein
VRVLITGMTLQQCGLGERTRLQYCSNPSLLRRAMEVGGHEVDQRPVKLGEPLYEYDAIVVGLANMLSFGSRFAYGALWAALMGVEYCNLAFLVDDWNVGATFNSMRGCARGEPDRALFRPVLPRDQRELARAEFWVDLLEVLSRLTKDRLPAPVIGSFFPWGDRSLFAQGTNIGELWPFDPTSLQPRLDPGTEFDSDRRRAWVLASLVKHEKWPESLGLSWPVERLGHLKSGAERLSEAEVVRRYGSRWGVMSPPYEHCGSGWWRARFKFAADAGAVLLASPAEVAGLKSYEYAYREREMLEHCPADDLRMVADWQARELREVTWDRATVVESVTNMVYALAGEEPYVPVER